MSKKWKAAMYGIAFVAGCEIGIAIQLMKMIHKFNVRESALNETIPEDDAADESETAAVESETLHEEALDAGSEICAEDDYVTDDYVTEDAAEEFPNGEVSPA